MKILGIQTGGHDSSAALLVDGRLVADVPEERFSRQKNDCGFPLQAIQYCLQHAGIGSEELDCIALPSNRLFRPLVRIMKFAPQHAVTQFKNGRIMEAPWTPSREVAPEDAMPLNLPRFGLSPKCRIFFAGHHAAHAASAYYSTPLAKERCVIATLDGVGDFSIGIWIGENGRLSLVQRYMENGSLGWFYSNVTEALGWRQSGDEWKTMGLAACGTPRPGILDGFHPEYVDGVLVREHDYGVFGAWQNGGTAHYHGPDAVRLAEIVARFGRENVAAEAQRVLEAQVTSLLFHWLEKERCTRLLCAGGVFQNVKLNQALWYSGRVSDFWIYPNPSDAGLAAGAAFLAHATHGGECSPITDVALGPSFATDEIRRMLRSRGLPFREVTNPAEAAVAHLLEDRAVAWFQGRLEAGSRALGNRSILISPCRVENKDRVNAKIKYRESFRPFGASILAEYADEYLVRPRDERYMMSTFQVKEAWRSRMPAVVHVDGTTRPQLVHREANPLYHELISRFGQVTGVHAILNTSFNVNKEPIVCTPGEAIRTFFDSGLDVLVLDRFVLEKAAEWMGPER